MLIQRGIRLMEILTEVDEKLEVNDFSSGTSLTGKSDNGASDHSEISISPRILNGLTQLPPFPLPKARADNEAKNDPIMSKEPFEGWFDILKPGIRGKVIDPVMGKEPFPGWFQALGTKRTAVTASNCSNITLTSTGTEQIKKPQPTRGRRYIAPRFYRKADQDNFFKLFER